MRKPVIVVSLLLATACTNGDPTTPPTPTTDQWPMPNLVGATLQDAQDEIQSLTDGALLLTSSHDLSGEDRNQVLDANWEVCTQNVAPGTAFTSSSTIDFGVVKTGEACP